MSDALGHWPRPMWTEGGGDAWVFFILFGTFPEVLPACPRQAYRTAGMPSDAQVRAFQRAEHSAWMDGWIEWPPGLMLREQDPELFGALAAAPNCIAVELHQTDPVDLGYLRDLVGMVTFLLDQGGVGVLDPQTLRYFSPSQWHQEVFDPGMAAPRAHVAVLASEEDEGPGNRRWYHTRGLRKFGRPDLSRRGVPEDQFEATEELLLRLLELQLLGGVIPAETTVPLPGSETTLVCYHRGDLDDPEFNNRHIELAAP